MKRFLLYLIITVGIPVVAAVPIASARMGGGGGGAPIHQGGGGGHWGGDHGGGFHGGGHDHDHFHDHSDFFFFGGFPLWYPYYGYAPAYPVDDSRSTLVLGHDAGKALKANRVSWDWFVEYLQAYILNAPS